MKIRVCIPSYKRPTVETLQVYPSCAVYVDEDEAEEYREANPGAEIVACPKGIQGNLCRVRNYILDKEFGNGADCVLLLDDDMQGVFRHDLKQGIHGMYGYAETLLNEEHLHEFLHSAAVLCEEWGFKFFGVNCVDDPLAYDHFRPFKTTAYIGGPFQAFLPNPLRYDEGLPLKEDYDMTLQHLNEYRGALRFDAYYYECRQSKQAGGCATYRNLKKEREQFERLQKKWGGAIIRQDRKAKRAFDYNPVLHSPIKGV